MLMFFVMLGAVCTHVFRGDPIGGTMPAIFLCLFSFLSALLRILSVEGEILPLHQQYLEAEFTALVFIFIFFLTLHFYGGQEEFKEWDAAHSKKEAEETQAD